MSEHEPKERYRIALPILTSSLILGFMAVLWLILKPFWVPILWAVVLTSTTWPAYTRFRRVIPSPAALAPLLSSLFLGIVLLVALVPLPVQLALELKEFASHLKTIDPAIIREKVAALPFGRDFVGALADSLISDPAALASMIDQHRESLLSVATTVARGFLSTLAVVAATLVSCFALYRYGENLNRDLRKILERIGGENIAQLLDTVNATVRGAAYSVLATAVAQGILAGIGYHITGAPTPLLLAVVTMIISLIPFGPPFMYIPVSAYLLFFSGLPWYHGVGLAVWGIVVVSTIDNVLRPLFISQSTKLSALLVFVGVLGGVTSMGLLGVFIGPAIIAVAHWIWLELAQATPAPNQNT